MKRFFEEEVSRKITSIIPNFSLFIVMDAIYSSFGNYMAQLGQLSYFQMMKGLNKAYHEENIFEVRGQPLEANDYKLIADIYNACRFMVASYGHLIVHGFLGEGSFKDRLLCVYTLKSKEQYMKALMNHLYVFFQRVIVIEISLSMISSTLILETKKPLPTTTFASTFPPCSSFVTKSTKPSIWLFVALGVLKIL